MTNTLARALVGFDLVSCICTRKHGTGVRPKGADGRRRSTNAVHRLSLLYGLGLVVKLIERHTS